MLQQRLQYSYITRWLATNGEVEEGVLSEGSHPSAGYGSMVLCSVVPSICYPVSPFIATEGDFNYLDNIVPHGQVVPPASLSSSIIGAYYAPLVLSYSNLTRALLSSSIICAYCAHLVLSYKHRRPVLLCLSDMRHDGYPIQILDSTLSNSSVPL
jgi:hypothetical protein